MPPVIYKCKAPVGRVVTVVSWVIVTVLLIGICQLLAFLLLRHRGRTTRRRRRRNLTPSRLYANEAAGGADRRAPAEGSRCPSCGAINGQSFTFCRQCVGRLARS